MILPGVRALAPNVAAGAALGGIGSLVLLGVLLPSVILVAPTVSVFEFHDHAIRLESAPLGPLSAYRDIWLHPLFNQHRKKDKPRPPPPPPPKPKPPDISQYHLIGIVTSPSMQLALVRRVGNDDTILRLKINDLLDGWTVVGIQTNGVSLSGGNDTALLGMAKPSSLSQRPVEASAGIAHQNE
jgi:hypothetical protein